VKVIGAGFVRTGTASLKAALEELGFGPCYHIQPELAVALQQAVSGIGVTANARLENIRRANIARTLALDAPLANALDQRMASDMADAQTTFQDRAGRNWDAEAYARMVLRTRVATTLNIGYVNKVMEFGSQYVRVFDGGPGTVDKPCRIANGQVWHIAVAATNLLQHPNCRRSFAALPPDYSGPVDRDIERVQLE
jgi:Sulfotransferase domain